MHRLRRTVQALPMQLDQAMPRLSSGANEISHTAAEAERIPLLRLQSLSKVYGALTAVAPLDLDIYPRDFVAILGPSGCGKTTLLRMIGGFVAPTTGTIEIDGRDVTRIGPEQRPTNMVFQGYGLFPHMNVRQNIGYGLRLQKMPKAEIDDRVAAALRSVAPRRLRRPLGDRAAVGRPAAARGAGARADHAAEGAAARRAARRARPQAAPRHAGGAAAHPSGDRRHLRVRHP